MNELSKVYDFAKCGIMHNYPDPKDNEQLLIMLDKVMGSRLENSGDGTPEARGGILVIDGLEISIAYNVENEKYIMLDFRAISGSYIEITLDEATALKKFLEYNIDDNSIIELKE